jgi:rhamnulose-1-phosphate aldolase/alcohol dehydrogenase
MESRWSDSEAEALKRRLESQYPDCGEALALRVYTSRLIGAEPDLVLHGGGNTSLKSATRDLYGEEVEVLHVKRSGWNLASIEPPDFPAVRLHPLRRLRGLDKLDDPRMVAEMRGALLDPNAPDPSVETLLHAFLPHCYVDHSHADAILVITNQPDAETRTQELFGERIAFVPYVTPGFDLARQAVEIFEKFPNVEGLVLEKHGLFTFGDDARTSYERHVTLVELAERHIEGRIQDRRLLDARPVVAIREAEEVAPIVRGALAEPTGEPDRPFRRWIVEHRGSEEILHFAAAEVAPRLAATAPVTPDHVIRTKPTYLLVPQPQYRDLEIFGAQMRAEVESYRHAYRAYFERNVQEKGVTRTPLDPTPRVVLLPGLGLFACGPTRRDARIAADIVEHTVRIKGWAEMIGHYQGISESELFDMEYWSLEQAKLGRQNPPPLESQVALVTGGAGAIGEGVARVLLSAGAHVVLVDVDEERLDAVRERIQSEDCEVVPADVAEEPEVESAFREASRLFGGVDVVVPTAGVAQVGELAELEIEEFERALRVNVTGTFLTVKTAMQHFKLQGTGGHIVIVSSKNVFAPGASFGAYSASKAGAHQIGRVAAIEGAPFGIRVNMVNPDAVFGSPDNPSGLWESVGPARAASRGLEPQELPEFYRQRNLLKAWVTPEHVGNAVLFFVTQQTPTTGAALPVDGGLPDAIPR